MICISSTRLKTLGSTLTANNLTVEMSEYAINVTLVDTDSNVGPTSFNVTLTDNEGIQPGTEYECSVTLEINGYTSAKSEPVFLATAKVTTGTYFLFAFLFGKLCLKQTALTWWDDVLCGISSRSVMFVKILTIQIHNCKA